MRLSISGLHSREIITWDDILEIQAPNDSNPSHYSAYLNLVKVRSKQCVELTAVQR